MIDFKKTLTNLHNEFPEFDLDTLFKIVDTIVEIPTITIPSGKSSDNCWWDDINIVTWTYDTKQNTNNSVIQ